MGQSKDDKIPVKYVLYAHYANREKQDFKGWDNGKGKPPAELDGIKFLISHNGALTDLLTSPGYEGLLVLFYAPGLAECFDGIDEGKSRDQLLKDSPELRFAEAVSSYIAEELRKNPELLRRLRFITALDLYDIFGRVKSLEVAELRWWVLGETSDIHYDAPKIVEAIVRLRLLGNGVPVFRLDWDVLFSGEAPAVDPGLFKAVAICLKAHRLRLDDPTVATFLFSASYDTRPLRNSPASTSFDRLAWRFRHANFSRIADCSRTGLASAQE